MNSANKPEMTEAQFIALSKLAHWHIDSKSTEAMRMVLMHDFYPSAAAKIVGVSHQSVSKTAKRARVILALAKELANPQSSRFHPKASPTHKSIMS